MKPGKVRPLALCVFRQDERICVSELYDPIKGQVFYRPMGGRIEFGEYGHQTVTREVREETGLDVCNVRYLGALENIFTYNGKPGHEIVLLYEGEFTDPAVYQADAIEGRDDQQTAFKNVWMPLRFFQEQQAPLYPDGLLELLHSAWKR